MFQKLKAFLFQNQSIRQTVAKNTFWLFFGEAFGRLARAAIVIYAARILGAAEWGVFSYAVTLAALFTIFSDIGVSALLTREAVKNPEMKPKYLSTAFFIRLVLLIICALIIILVAPFFTKIEAAKPLLVFAALLLIFDGLREFSFAINRALEKMEREAGVKIFTNISIVAIGFIFLLTAPSAKSLAIAYVLGSVAGFLMILWILRSDFKNLIVNFTKNLVWPILKSAWPFALLGLLGGIMINTDIIMLSFWRTAQEVGYYSAAQKPIQLLYIFPALFAISLFPTFARLANKENEKFRNVFEKGLKVVLLGAIPLVFGGIILGKETIILLFGNEYLPSVTAFQILLVTLLIVFPSILISNSIFAYNRQRNFVGYLALGAFGNVGLNALLIPPFGIEGSAVATIGAQLLANGFVWLKMKKINYFVVLPYLKKVLLAAILMALVAYILKYAEVNFIANLIISALVYFGLLAILKEPVLKELKTTILRGGAS